MRYVVTLSGGEGSWGSGRYLIDSLGVSPEQVTLLFTDTNGEDADLYRFLRECADDLGSELVWIDNDGQTIWDVFRKNRMIGNTRLSVCSRVLKQEPARRWLEANTDPTTVAVVVGIDWTEADRLPAITRNYQPWKVIAPLTEPGSWSKERIIKELAARGIERARLYAQGFSHNNCGGACVRAGQGQWELLLRTNPERYASEEAQEESLRDHLGKDVAILRDRRGGTTKPLTLRRFRERLEDQPDLFDADDIGGCGCMSLPMVDVVIRPASTGGES
jgi:3'-phosphoadenosine 5'-phosphosulfate sulfotransferase (PAPS reductase)/FAD synthetase